jgi:hypothetical protein
MWFEKQKFRPPPRILAIKWKPTEYRRKKLDALDLEEFIRLRDGQKSAAKSPGDVASFVGKL